MPKLLKCIKNDVRETLYIYLDLIPIAPHNLNNGYPYRIGYNTRITSSSGESMSIFNRIARAFDSFDKIRNDEISTFGMAGEKNARSVIDEEDGMILYNRIIPHPKDRNKFLEMDAIIYNSGNIYSIEIKNYKGKITFKPAYKTIQEKKKFLFFFTRTVNRQTQSGWDDAVIVKAKEGNHGEGTFLDEFTNPMKKTKYFINNFKNYLSSKNSLFNQVNIKAVVAFNRDNADISDIHSFEKGYIYIDEISRLIEKNSSRTYKEHQWLRKELLRLSTWDTVVTSTNEQLYGIIKGSGLTVNTLDNDAVNLKYKDITSIDIKRTGTFSKEDRLIVKFADGAKSVYKNIRSVIVLDKFGDLQEHKISNLNFVDVGTWRLREEKVIK